MNIPDAGGVPVNWPTFDRGALRGMPLPRDLVICAYCDATLRHDSRGRCTNCAAPAWPPRSQEDRAAAHGLTRTRAASDPKCALCQDDRVVNYPGEGRDACPNCSGGSRR